MHALASLLQTCTPKTTTSKQCQKKPQIRWNLHQKSNKMRIAMDGEFPRGCLQKVQMKMKKGVLDSARAWVVGNILVVIQSCDISLEQRSQFIHLVVARQEDDVPRHRGAHVNLWVEVFWQHPLSQIAFSTSDFSNQKCLGNFKQRPQSAKRGLELWGACCFGPRCLPTKPISP